jgi:hypothetical protein
MVDSHHTLPFLTLCGLRGIDQEIPCVLTHSIIEIKKVIAAKGTEQVAICWQIHNSQSSQKPYYKWLHLKRK